MIFFLYALLLAWAVVLVPVLFYCRKQSKAERRQRIVAVARERRVARTSRRARPVAIGRFHSQDME